jgi:hypothetical protein
MGERTAREMRDASNAGQKTLYARGVIRPGFELAMPMNDTCRNFLSETTPSLLKIVDTVRCKSRSLSFRI